MNFTQPEEQQEDPKHPSAKLREKARMYLDFLRRVNTVTKVNGKFKLGSIDGHIISTIDKLILQNSNTHRLVRELYKENMESRAELKKYTDK